ncbi:MAG: hypothetical protein ACLFM0_00720 [Spirochaetales bacterium]
MNAKETLGQSVSLSKTHYQLFVPTVVATLLAGLITLLGGLASGAQTVEIQAASGPAEILGSFFTGQSLWVNMVFGALSSVVLLIGHGATLAIAHQLADGNQPSFRDAFERIRSRFVALVIAAAIVGILVGIGTTLLLLPGLIAAYLLMFTFVAVVGGGLEPLPALKRSYNIVTGNFGETAILFLLLLAIGVVYAVVASILNLIPAVGGLIGLLLGGIYAGLSSMILLIGYRSFEALPTAGGSQSTGESSAE